MLPKIVLTLALLVSCFTVTSAQVVVAQKPEAPQQRKQLKAPADDSFFLVPAEWAVKDGAYFYVQPRYVKQRPGLKYVSGKWKKVKGGWMWKPAFWQER